MIVCRCSIIHLTAFDGHRLIGFPQKGPVKVAHENDVVLIYFEDQPLTFARIEDISPDIKKDWYLVKLLILQVPLQIVTWILRGIYIDGAEFTMDGKKMRLEKVVCPQEPEISAEKDETPQKLTDQKIISLADIKKKDFSDS